MSPPPSSACRWGHRESTDIDLTVPVGTGIPTLDDRIGGTLRADMTAAGAADVVACPLRPGGGEPQADVVDHPRTVRALDARG